MYEVILDIDGVLVNTDGSYTQAALLAAQALGGRLHQPEDVFELRSQGSFNDDYDITIEFLRQDGIQFPREEVINVFQNFYLGKNWSEGSWTGLITQEPLLATPDFCQWIRPRPFSVFTGRPKEEAFYVMRRLNLFDAMHHLVAMYDVVRKKPDPEGLEQIITLNNYQNPISCGDTLDDWQASQKAGIDFIAILPPHPQAQQLMRPAFEKAGCPVILENINQMPDYLQNKENS